MTEYRQEQLQIDEEAKKRPRIWLRCVQSIDKQTRLNNIGVFESESIDILPFFGSLTAWE